MPSRFRLTFAFLTLSSMLSGALYERGRQLMVCHRTANRDAPENTLEAIREAKNLGCDVIETDISRTLDGVLVLLHDGPIDRVSSGSGEVEKILYNEMALYDAGSWFNSRFHGIHHARFLDGLRLAKDLGLKIELDLKSKGVTRQVYEMVRAEGMLDRVSFGGHAEELPQVAPDLQRQSTASWKQNMDRAAVDRLHEQGKFVIASFSYNDHELDFPLMQRAVAAGVDGLSTDHPRIAADALGRSLEKAALALAQEARQGERTSRLRAISRLSDRRDLPLTAVFSSLLWDADPAVSRAAAVALARRREADAVPGLISEFTKRGSPPYAAANIAWLAGMTGSEDAAVHEWVLRMAASADPTIAMEALRALASSDAPVPVALLRRRLEDPQPLVRGAAARALARHDRSSAPLLIAAAHRMQKEIFPLWSSYASPAPQSNDLAKARTTFERPNASRPGAAEQIAKATDLYRGYHNVFGALASLHTPEADRWLHQETLRSAPDFSGIATYVAGMQLWDRADPAVLAPALENRDLRARDRIEWTLIKRGAPGFAKVRALLNSSDKDTRVRAAQILAWGGDQEAKLALSRLAESDAENRKVYEWCLGKLAELEMIQKVGG